MSDNDIIIRHDQLSDRIRDILTGTIWNVDSLQVDIDQHKIAKSEPRQSFYATVRLECSPKIYPTTQAIRSDVVIASNTTVLDTFDLHRYLTNLEYKIWKTSAWINNELADLTFYCRLQKNFNFDAYTWKAITSTDALSSASFPIDVFLHPGSVWLTWINTATLEDLLSPEAIQAVWSQCTEGTTWRHRAPLF